MRQIAREAGGADFVERRIATAEIPRIAELLQSYGVQPGDKLAVVSDWLFPSREGAYVCRLARAQIIGEVRPQQFWSADETTRAKLIEIYKNAGAKALFAYEPSRVEPGWERLGSSNYYLYLMRSKARQGRTVKMPIELRIKCLALGRVQTPVRVPKACVGAEIAPATNI